MMVGVILPALCPSTLTRNWVSIAGSKTSCINSICTTARRWTKAGKQVFEKHAPQRTERSAGPAAAPGRSCPRLQPHGDDVQPLRGIAAQIAENMAASLSIPLATSQRTIAVKVMDENRRIINQHRTLVGKSKVSYTHMIGWAIVKALEDIPALNHAYAEAGRRSRSAWCSREINLGIAVDVAGKDGARSLMVPNIKNAGALNFRAVRDGVRRPGGARAQRQADAARFPGHHDFADQSGHGGHHGLDPAADARAGRDHRHGRHRLSGRISGRAPKRRARCWASAR